MSIPPPGVPREIPELNQAVLDSLHEDMDEGNTSSKYLRIGFGLYVSGLPMNDLGNHLLEPN